MKRRWILDVITLAWILLCFAYLAQSQTDEVDRWAKHRRTVIASESFNTPFVITLFSADATLRVIDGYTTVTNLNDPCRCYKERNPFFPQTGNRLEQAVFQAGALAVVYTTAYLFNRHGHPKIARALVMADIGSEAYAVTGNYRSRP